MSCDEGLLKMIQKNSARLKLDIFIKSVYDNPLHFISKFLNLKLILPVCVCCLFIVSFR